MSRFVVGCFFVLLFAGSLHAQSFTTTPCNDDEGNNNWFGHPGRVCELRRTTLPLINGQLSVSGENGGIEVIGEERQDIALEARVIAQGADRDELLWRAGDVLSWIGSGKLKLLIEKNYPLSEAAEAHRDLEGRKTTGKLLIIP